MHHPLFGPFLTNWAEHRVFPRRGKILMFVTMDISLIVLWFTTQNIWLVLCVGTVMLLVTIWAWRFPETVEQAQERISQGRKLGWFGRF